MRVGVDLISERGVASGIHTYANRLLEAMAVEAASGGEEVELVVLHHDDFQWLFSPAAHPALRLVSTGRRAPGALARRFLEQTLVPEIARREKLDLVHSVNNVLPLRLPVPGVVTVHDLSAFALPQRFRWPKRAFLRWAVPRSVRLARRVITDSRATKEDILRWVEGASGQRIAVVGLGADPRFNPRRDPVAEARLRERHELPREFILSVGAAEPGKNLGGMARALLDLRREEGIAIPWVLAGAAGRGARRLRGLLRRDGLHRQAILLGVVPDEDLPHLYRMATVFVFPSLHEGFGLPLLEALACGIPALTSDRSSLPEVAGRAALKVNPERPRAIARALRRLWRLPGLRARLAERGPEQAALFSWREAARETLRIYREALEGCRSPAAAPSSASPKGEEREETTVPSGGTRGESTVRTGR